MSEAFTWLHLSDVHARKTEKTEQKRLWRAIATDIKGYMQGDVTGIGRPDVIFVSGDVVQEGKPEHFEIAREALAVICDAAELPSASVYLVPGNHDINRDKLPKNDEDLKKLRMRVAHADDLREAVDRFWESGALQQLERKFTSYIEFAQDYASVTPLPLGAWVACPVAGFPVQLCGLNTVWNGGNATLDAAGVPLVGVFQRESVNAALGDVGDDVTRIVIQHNSTDYLNVLDGILHDAWLGQFDAIVFSGHVHNAQTAERRSVDGRHLSVIGGALYSGYHGAAPRCYSVGQLCLDHDNDVRKFAIDLRKQTDGGHFGADTDRYRLAPSGRLEFGLSKRHRVLGAPVAHTNGTSKGLRLLSDFVSVRLDDDKYIVTFKKVYRNDSVEPCDAVNARLIVNAFPTDAAKARKHHRQHPLDLRAAKFRAESEGRTLRREMVHDHDAHKEVMLIFENAHDGAFPLEPDEVREVVYSLSVPTSVWGPYLERNVRLATERLECELDFPIQRIRRVWGVRDPHIKKGSRIEPQIARHDLGDRRIYRWGVSSPPVLARFRLNWALAQARGRRLANR